MKAASSYFFIILLSLPLAPGFAGIRSTAHDFPMFVPELLTLVDVKVCRYCHRAHSPGPGNVPSPPYNPYLSPNFRSQPGQPDGASRQCLQCHDGTKTLGSLWKVFSGTDLLPRQIKKQYSLGTNLADDHPVSIVYDRHLVRVKGNLADPANLPIEVRIDGAGKVQCSSCHDPHSDRFGKFLVMDNRLSQLCTSCHRFPPPGVVGSGHSAAQGLCQDCHQIHGAYQPQWLLNSKSWDRRIPR